MNLSDPILLRIYIAIKKQELVIMKKKKERKKTGSEEEGKRTEWYYEKIRMRCPSFFVEATTLLSAPLFTYVQTTI